MLQASAILCAGILACTFSTAVNAQAKDSSVVNKKNKKEVTRIIITKEQDGKSIKIDTTFFGEFDKENFAKDFDFDFPDFPTPPGDSAEKGKSSSYTMRYAFSDDELKKEMDNLKIELQKVLKELQLTRNELSKTLQEFQREYKK